MRYLDAIAEALDVKKAEALIKKLDTSRRKHRAAGSEATGNAMAARATERATEIPSAAKIIQMRLANKAAGKVSKREATIKRVKDAIETARENPENYPSLR